MTARLASSAVASASASVPAPIIRWAGGKSRVVATLQRLAPRSYWRYVEPFLGSGALFFALQPESAVLSDSCAELIEMYDCVRSLPFAVSHALSDLTLGGHTAERYYQVRASWNADRRDWSLVRRAATFLYLNRVGYNGLWRVNRSGQLNTPAGRPSQGVLKFPCGASLARASSALHRAQLSFADYAETMARVRRGDFVYVDPPYLPGPKRPSFVSYGAVRFGLEDHERLADAVHAVRRGGAHVMVSHVESRVIRKLYRGFRVHKVSALRSISAATRVRASVTELVFVGEPA